MLVHLGDSRGILLQHQLDRREVSSHSSFQKYCADGESQRICEERAGIMSVILVEDAVE
jgi:hypothetical protein